MEEEYERLREEEAEIDYFERIRVRQLEEEVAFFEREIKERSRDIEDLNRLFRIRMEERQQQTQMQPQPQFVHLPQPYSKNTGTDDTSISSIPPNP